MTVNLYKINTENIRVDKTAYLGTATAYTADYGFEGNQNVETPSIIINSTTQPDFNYCYIDSFNRYYYIIAKTWISDSVWRLSLLVDPLMSFKTDIGNQAGICTYSGSGNAKKYDPRVVFNLPPVRSETAPGTDTDGGDFYILMACRYTFTTATIPPGMTYTVNNQMLYSILSGQAYSYFIDQLITLRSTDQQMALAVMNTIVSVTLIKYVSIPSSGSKQQSLYFASPEIMNLTLNHTYEIIDCNPSSGTQYTAYQVQSTDALGKYDITFSDVANSYADRKAQRLFDIPFVGQMSIDLDSLALPLSVGAISIGVSIRYDVGGNEYVCVPFYNDGTNTTYYYSEYATFPNSFTASFISETSYAAETETRLAQILSLLSTAAMGVVTGIASEGATVPATITALGIGAANFALNEAKLRYQKASSVIQKGSSNGGSAYVALRTPFNVSRKVRLVKLTPQSSTNVFSFQGRFGKPDGEYRTLSTLSGTGFAQLGTVILTGFTGATNNEKNMIREALLTGVIL